MFFKVRNTEQIYQLLKKFLYENGVDGALDRRVIFQKVFGYPHYHAGERPDATDEQLILLEKLCRKRVSGYPLQYIAGSWPFLDFEVLVGEGVLIPRPDTESVAMFCGDLLRDIPGAAAVDLCAGTGCIAAAIKRAAPQASVTAVEYLPEAYQYLCRNIDLLRLDVKTPQADVFSYQNELADESVDLIVSNPPYISEEEYRALQPELYYEPRHALCDNTDGLRFYRHIAAAYYSKIKPGGRLVLEVGDSRADSVMELIDGFGYSSVKLAEDMFRNPRVLSAEK